ncbi:hypothetical protein THRCLA_06433 [Thraustotheca clavata]|uniref:EF-hand domain-containing protein n=1 Tax=Thraustotheca clavata TaxID=74557 RepID=A0A1V9ZNT5_9STRA|nr:hypothetical protein THRCLA_06433 [Thraustotheca clavata]
MSNLIVGVKMRNKLKDKPQGTTVVELLAMKLRLKLEQLIPIENERLEKAFYLFTTGDVIVPQAFHMLLIKFRVCANRQQSYALFNWFDIDSTGKLDRNKFKRGVFGTVPNNPKPPKTPMSPIRPSSHRSLEPQIVKKAAPVTDRLAHKPMILHHHPARAQHEVKIGDNIPFEEIIKRIRDKIDQRTSKASDRFRQAFKIFTKASGITLNEFHEGMLLLGFRLSPEQNKLLFDTFDTNKSGDLDLNEFVKGISLDDYSIKYLNAHIERQRKEETRRKRYAAAVHSVEASWSIEDMERKLREKIEQHTSKSSDCFRQALQIFKKTNGIKPQEFHNALADMGLNLPRECTTKLFQKYDIDGSGDIDLSEFVRGVLPADYTQGTWVAEADEMARQEARRKQLQPDSYYNRVNIDHWSLDMIENKLREKITQKTSKSSDTFRQVYRVFGKSNGITFEDFQRSILVLGFRLNHAQARGLFDRYDSDHSNTIELAEFCKRVLPPDYTGDGDNWGMTDEERKQKRIDAIAYVAATKNGTIRLATRPTSAPPARPPNNASRPLSPPRKPCRPQTSQNNPVNIWREGDNDTSLICKLQVQHHPPMSPMKRASSVASVRPLSARTTGQAIRPTSEQRPSSATIARPTVEVPQKKVKRDDHGPVRRKLNTPSATKENRDEDEYEEEEEEEITDEEDEKDTIKSLRHTSVSRSHSVGTSQNVNVHRRRQNGLLSAKFSPRNYSHGFKRIILQMAKDKLVSQ